MQKAGIAIDTWKLPIFERHLSQAGYVYEKGPGVTVDTLLLIVKTESVEPLTTVLRAAHAEVERTRTHERSNDGNHSPKT